MKWTQEEDNKLKQLKDQPAKLVAKLLNRSIGSIKNRKVILGIVRPIKTWSDDENQFIKDNYLTMEIRTIAEQLNISAIQVKSRIKYLKLRKEPDQASYDKLTPEVLLGDDPIAFYWIGFILADGTFDNRRLRFSLSRKDLPQLEKYAKFINAPYISHETTSNMSGVAFTHDVVLNIISKFKIKPNCKKTYNPPDLLSCDFTIKQWISLIIGFIDGDGSIDQDKRTKTCSSRIGVHPSWQQILQLFQMKLNEASGVKSKSKINIKTRWRNKIAKKIYPDKKLEQTVNLNIPSKIIKYLYKFCIDQNIPYLFRKWERITL